MFSIVINVINGFIDLALSCYLYYLFYLFVSNNVISERNPVRLVLYKKSPQSQMSSKNLIFQVFLIPPHPIYTNTACNNDNYVTYIYYTHGEVSIYLKTRLFLKALVVSVVEEDVGQKDGHG